MPLFSYRRYLPDKVIGDFDFLKFLPINLERRRESQFLTREQLDAYLADMDLTEFAADHPMALSGGQKQRIAAAAACAAKKKYLYFRH